MAQRQNGIIFGFGVTIVGVAIEFFARSHKTSEGGQVKKLIIIIVSILVASFAYASGLELEKYSIGSNRIGYYVYGYIKNNTGKTCQSVCVNFSLYSSVARDRLIGSVGVCERGLKDGARWEFETYSAQSSYAASVADLNSLKCTH